MVIHLLTLEAKHILKRKYLAKVPTVHRNLATLKNNTRYLLKKYYHHIVREICIRLKIKSLKKKNQTISVEPSLFGRFDFHIVSYACNFLFVWFHQYHYDYHCCQALLLLRRRIKESKSERLNDFFPIVFQGFLWKEENSQIDFECEFRQ